MSTTPDYYSSHADTPPKSKREIARDLILGSVATAIISGIVLHLQHEPATDTEPLRKDDGWSMPFVD